jgi:hypothetical protein
MPEAEDVSLFHILMEGDSLVRAQGEVLPDEF